MEKEQMTDIQIWAKKQNEDLQATRAARLELKQEMAELAATTAKVIAEKREDGSAALYQKSEELVKEIDQLYNEI